MRYQVCVSGAASGATVEMSDEKAYELGAKLAQRRATILTGATTGLPLFAARGFLSVPDRVGASIGFSPASSFIQHVSSYRLPVDEFDFINFTGMNYVGRDQYLVQSSDAVITLGGRIGSLHELVTAVVSNKIVAVLTGTGGVADTFQKITQEIEVEHGNKIIFSDDIDELLDAVYVRLDEKYAGLQFDGADLITGKRMG
jgi:uncharacterized protein (TIGR00725 family)